MDSQGFTTGDTERRKDSDKILNRSILEKLDIPLMSYLKLWGFFCGCHAVLHSGTPRCTGTKALDIEVGVSGGSLGQWQINKFTTAPGAVTEAVHLTPQI